MTELVVRPRTVFLHVTKACNLRCAYCYFSARRPLPDELATREFDALWPDLVELGPQKVVFTGGEPLLRPDLFDLLRGLRAADPQHAVLRCLNSNGHPVTVDVARELVGLADEVRVSIDGLRERNDALRGRGNFDAALNALEIYHSVGFEPKALVTVTTESLPDLEGLLCLLIERGIRRININAFRPVGRGRRHREWAAPPSDMSSAVRRAWVRSCPDIELQGDDDSDDLALNCGVGQFLNIMPNGDVFPCHVLTDPEFRCGNLRTERLLAICRREGLLGTLRELDFGSIAGTDPELAALAGPNVCMGEVYANTRSTAAWSERVLTDGPAVPADRGGVSGGWTKVELRSR